MHEENEVHRIEIEIPLIASSLHVVFQILLVCDRGIAAKDACSGVGPDPPPPCLPLPPRLSSRTAHGTWISSAYNSVNPSHDVPTLSMKCLYKEVLTCPRSPSSISMSM